MCESLLTAGVAGYTWVAVLHLWWGLSFKATLMLANITSVAWLLIYHAVLPPIRSEAVSQLHTLTSGRSSGMTHPPLDQIDACSGRETDAQALSMLDERQSKPGLHTDAVSPVVLFAAQELVFQCGPVLLVNTCKLACLHTAEMLLVSSLCQAGVAFSVCDFCTGFLHISLP